MTDVTAQAERLTISERAARQISKILTGEPEGTRLRLSVSGGGCSGFQYGFTLDTGRTDEDLIFSRDGVDVVVDEISLEYLEGSEVDYVDDLIGASFQVRNPNATSSCGCGTSFAV